MTPAYMRSGRIAVLAAMLGTSLACGESGRAGKDAEGRRVLELSDTLWVRHSSPTDTILLRPVRMVSDGMSVYVLDRGARRLLAFDARTGDLLWTSGREGHGPGEFSTPGFLTVLRNGNIAVADRSSDRITILSPAGKLVSTLRAPSGTEGVCAPTGDELLVEPNQGPFALVLLSVDGSERRGFRLPWPEQDTLPFLGRQFNLSSDPRAVGCWISFSTADLFARFDSAVGEAHKYVEPVALSRVIQTTKKDAQGRVHHLMRLDHRPSAAQSAAVRGDTLLVMYGGSGPLAYRVIDSYDGTGTYIRSFHVRMVVQDLTVGDGVVFLLGTEIPRQKDDDRTLYPTLVALRTP